MATLLAFSATSAALAADPASGSLPVPPEAEPGGPSVALADTSAETRDAFSGVGLLDHTSSCSAVLIAPGSGAPPGDAPAYVLTNGHCVDLFDTSTVLRDVAIEDGAGSVRFGTDEAGQPLAEVPLSSIRWATMKGTDLAVVELGDTLSGLLARGVRAYPVGAAAEPATPLVVVGGPTPVDGSERVLRLAACTAGDRVDLLERHWAWFGFGANDCADILPGSSGSPVLDPATGSVVGLINTTTQGSEGVSDCSLGRPCEMGPDGVASVEGAAYGPTLDVLAGCFDDAWTFTGPGAACTLDPGIGVRANSWTIATNPGATAVSGVFTAPSTWDADLEGTRRVRWMRTAVGPAGVIDCHDPATYGDPRRIPTKKAYGPKLPEASGHWLMCIRGGPDRRIGAGWQSAEHPTVLHVDIDRTPPLMDVELAIGEFEEAWSVEPVFRAPELSLFDWKWGPPDTTDCDDLTGYTPYRRFPAEIPFADGPTRMCVIGYDDATNRAPTLDHLLTPP